MSTEHLNNMSNLHNMDHRDKKQVEKIFKKEQQITYVHVFCFLLTTVGLFFIALYLMKHVQNVAVNHGIFVITIAAFVFYDAVENKKNAKVLRKLLSHTSEAKDSNESDRIRPRIEA